MNISVDATADATITAAAATKTIVRNGTIVVDTSVGVIVSIGYCGGRGSRTVSIRISLNEYTIACYFNCCHHFVVVALYTYITAVFILKSCAHSHAPAPVHVSCNCVSIGVHSLWYVFFSLFLSILCVCCSTTIAHYITSRVCVWCGDRITYSRSSIAEQQSQCARFAFYANRIRIHFHLDLDGFFAQALINTQLYFSLFFFCFFIVCLIDTVKRYIIGCARWIQSKKRPQRLQHCCQSPSSFLFIYYYYLLQWLSVVFFWFRFFFFTLFESFVCVFICFFVFFHK